MMKVKAWAMTVALTALVILSLGAGAKVGQILGA